MLFLTIASSSKGNAALVVGRTSCLLIDAGVSLRSIQGALTHLPRLVPLAGVLVSHEHTDHMRGLGPLLRKMKVPCFSSEGTRQVLTDGRLGAVDRERFEILPENGRQIGEFHITPLALSHDALEPTGFVVSDGRQQLVTLTDTGMVTDVMKEALFQSHFIFMEANHDPDMLARGPYPSHIKRRILGDKGHLSNQTTAEVLQQVIGPRQQQIVLAHLSETNNHPELALNTILNIIGHVDIPISVARPQSPCLFALGEEDAAFSDIGTN